jgi:hypothetical protein
MPKEINPDTQRKIDMTVQHLKSAIVVLQTIDDKEWNGTPGPPEDLLEDVDAVIKKLGVVP